MKKLLSLVLAIMACVASYAASPNLQDITLTNSNGETLDFYADRCNLAVYHAPGSPISRPGQYYIGSTISNVNGNVEARFTVEIPVGSELKTLSGTIFYNSSSGLVYRATLNGSTYSSGHKAIVPRRR